RTSIDTSVMGLLSVFNTGQVRDLLASGTSVTPADMEKGTWVMVNLPITPGDATATFVNTAMKYSYAQYILSREAKEGDPILCIWSDASQRVGNSDARAFVEACRSHRGFLVALSQSIHALYAVMSGQGGEHEADALMTNFGHVVCHTLGDAKSAKY